MNHTTGLCGSYSTQLYTTDLQSMYLVTYTKFNFGRGCGEGNELVSLRIPDKSTQYLTLLKIKGKINASKGPRSDSVFKMLYSPFIQLDLTPGGGGAPPLLKVIGTCRWTGYDFAGHQYWHRVSNRPNVVITIGTGYQIGLMWSSPLTQGIKIGLLGYGGLLRLSQDRMPRSPQPPTQYYLGYAYARSLPLKAPPYLRTDNISEPPPPLRGLFAGISCLGDPPKSKIHCSMYSLVFYFITPFLNFSGVQRERERKTTPFLKKSPGEKSNIPLFYNSRAGLCRTKSTPLPEILGTRMRSLRGGGGGVANLRFPNHSALYFSEATWVENQSLTLFLSMVSTLTE